MTPYLDRNLAALRAGSATPGLAALREATGCLFRYVNAVPVLEIATPDGRRLSLHSQRNPPAEARQQLDAALAGDAVPSRVALLRPGLGFLIDAVEERAPQARLLVIEPDPSLVQAMLMRRDFSSLIVAGRLTILWGPDYPGALDAWTLFDVADSAPLVLVNTVLAREQPGPTREAQQLLARLVRDGRENHRARRRFAVPYLLNTLRNVPAIAEARDVGDAAGLCAGVPAIVVAAGPSLDRNLEGVQAVAGRAVVIAVDTAVKPLLVRDVVPHFIVAADPGAFNALDFVGLPSRSPSWLVTEGSVAPPVLAMFAGRTLVFRVGDHAPWPFLRAHGIDAAMLRAWSSVLVTALDAASALGCDPLVTVGADLSFPGGRRYCSSVEIASIVASGSPQTRLLVSDVRGEPVESNHAFVSARDWIVAHIASRRPRPLFNATGAGILCGRGVELIDTGDLPAVLRGGASPRLGALARLPPIGRGRRAWVAAMEACLDPEREPVAGWLASGAIGLTDRQVRMAALDALGNPAEGRRSGPVHEAQLFSSPDGDYTEAGSVVRNFPGGRWVRLRFEIPGGRLRLDPVGRAAIVSIARISVRAPSGECWNASRPADFDQLAIGTDANRIPHDRHLLLFCHGGDPMCEFPDLGPPWSRSDLALRVTICLKADRLNDRTAASEWLRRS